MEQGTMGATPQITWSTIKKKKKKFKGKQVKKFYSATFSLWGGISVFKELISNYIKVPLTDPSLSFYFFPSDLIK